MNRFERCLTIGISCLLSLSVASRTSPVLADDAGTSPEQESVVELAPQRIAGAVTNEPVPRNQLIVPPFLRDERGDVRTTVLFPFYFDRKAPKLHQRLVTPYFYQRSPSLNADVALGLAWSLRGPDQNSFVLAPLFYSHRQGKDWGLGLLPLFSTGEFAGHHHTVIPSLLTWIDGDKDDRRTVIGPFFDFRKKNRIVRGLFPFLWSRSNDVNRFTIVPPFFFRFADDDPLRITTVVPPFYHLRRGEETSYGLMPLFFRNTSPKYKSLTVPALLFHHASGEGIERLVTPLFAYSNDAKEGRSLITPLYQHKRGDKNYNAALPFFFRGWDNRDMSDALHFPPFYFRWRDPANDSLSLIPFFGRYQHDGISTTWVTPFVGHYKSLERDEQTWWFPPTVAYGWDQRRVHFNIHPLFYWQRGEEKSHLAIAPLWFNFENHAKLTKRLTLVPLYWDFSDQKKQTSARVLFPFYWKFDNGRKQTHRLIGFPLYWDVKNDALKTRTVVAFPLYVRHEHEGDKRHFVLNTMYEQKGPPEKRSTAVHVFPFTAWGKNATGRWWNVFYGLAGYEQRGTHKRIHAFWIPFNLK